MLQGEANGDHRLRPRNTLEDCPGWKLDLRPARVHAEDPEPAKQNKGTDDRNKCADDRTKATDNRDKATDNADWNKRADIRTRVLT